MQSEFKNRKEADGTAKEGYLINKAAIDAMDGEMIVHFLNDNAICSSKVLGHLTGLTGIGVSIVRIMPGHESTEPHLHHREDECVYILSGVGLAKIGPETFEIAEGDFLGYRKGGLAHGITNTGDTVLRCLVIGQRGDTDVVDYPEKDVRMFRTSGMDWNVVDTSDIRPRPRR